MVAEEHSEIIIHINSTDILQIIPLHKMEL